MTATGGGTRAECRCTTTAATSRTPTSGTRTATAAATYVRVCPLDPDNDADGDRICVFVGPAASLYKSDNCPRVQNGAATAIGQANCNEEAEAVKKRANASFEVLGDACDPVPCPRTRAVGTREVRFGPGGGHPQFGGCFSGRGISEDIESTRVAPHV